MTACFCGSSRALTIVWLTFAAVSVLSRYGRSNCSQRTDDFVSGSSTQTSAVAVFWAGFATAAVTATLTAASATTDRIKNFFTMVLLLVIALTCGGATLQRSLAAFNAPP